MTELIYLNDSYLKEFDAKVLKVEGKLVVLDKTAFYPQGGGQLSDTGEIISNNSRYKVLSVKKIQGEVFHELDREGIKISDVHCIIDGQRRHKMMRMHTAAHILSTIFNKESGALITGNQLDLEKTRIDFSLENFDREKINDYFAKANEIVKTNLPLKVYYIPRHEAEKDHSLTKLAKGLPEGIAEIRIVEIKSFDIQADGGTHVKSTNEVGNIIFISAENKGKDNRRVYFRLE